MAEVKVLGKVRGISRDIFAVGREDEQIALSGQGEQLVAPAAAEYQEICRQGLSLFINTTTAIGAVVAIPSTAHMLAIYNNEADGGPSLIIDWVAAQNVVTTAVAGQAQMIGILGQVRETAPTNSALTQKNLNGFGNTDSKVFSILNATALPAATGLAANWFPLGQSASKPGVAATPGYGMHYEVKGKIIVPPGRYFAVHVLANVVGETFVAFIAWHKKQLLLG
ncbi:hypothetical protein KW797_04080 [Candidatus Parcubacteria bacterium]|nr:hypothetical protein [Candidatus Parcubacteria bacterium]